MEVSKLVRLVLSAEVDMFVVVAVGLVRYALRKLPDCPVVAFSVLLSPGLAAMPNIRCPSCCKTFPNNTRLLQHMNQPRGHCITGRLLTNTRSFLFPDLGADSDVGGGEDDDDWQYISQELDGSGFEEAPNFMGGTQIGDPDPFIECYPGASANYGRGHTFMDTFNADRFSSERQSNLFYPFSSKAEWEFASWLANSGLSMATIDKCLSLDIVCSSPDLHTSSADAIFQIKSLMLSFRTARALRKLIELLPSGPQWKHRSIKPESPVKHDFQLFYRDAIECLQHLLHSPSLSGQIEFVPKKIYSAADRMERIYTEWLTGDRAWELQVCTIAGSSTIDHFYF